MDVKEYIESGIIEMYAMNALSSDEKKEFERLLIIYPEIFTELNKVEVAMEKYTHAHAINPRPQFRTKIIASISEPDLRKAKVIKSKATNGNANPHLTYKYLIAASLAALVISTFASWFFYSRWNEAEERYTNLLDDKNELAESYNLVKFTYDETMSAMLIMSDENARIFMLNSRDTVNDYKARVYWNQLTHRVYIDVIDLPIPEEGMQYQLWTIVNGKPIDAGVFALDEEFLQRLKDIELAGTWTVTLEPKGGSTVPSMNRMFLFSSSSYQ